MLTDANLLQTLSTVFNDNDRQVVVGRLLRVPEIWNALHVPEFLATAAEHSAPEAWLPGRLAALAYGEDSLSAMLERGMELDGDQDSLAPGSDPHGIEEVSALAIHLLVKADVEIPDRDLMLAIRENPGLWTSPLACAWPDLISTSWLKDYFPKDPDQGHVRMLVQALLANQDLLAAAQAMVALEGKTLAAVFPLLRECGYDALYAALGQLSIEKLAEVGLGREQSPRPALTATGILLAATGDSEGAHQAFRQAWEMSNETSSEIADQLASFARAEGDAILEMEARKQALQSSISAERKAALVRVLVELGKTEEAAQWIDAPECVHSWIAAAAYQGAVGNDQQSSVNLGQACALLTEETVTDEWLAWLVELLKERKDFARALDVQLMRCESAAAEPTRVLELARLYQAAGNASAAANQAELALALNPDSSEARLLLAQMLQDSDQPEQALVHWKSIQTEHPEYWPALSRCALKAGDVKLARDTAASALAAEPDSYSARVLLGEALTLDGDPAGGLIHLGEAAEMHPQEPEAWLALANAHDRLKDEQASGEALRKGVQAAPGSGELHMAMARWLLKSDQPSQALEHVRAATGLHPAQSDWRIEQAEILRDLGRTEEALPELRTALATQPENWQARKALALTYELMGEYALAGQTFSRLPEDLDAESKFHAGRILVRSVSEGGPGDSKTATALLVGALEAGHKQASIWYWLANSYEQAQLLPQAVEAYKAFLDQVEDDHPQKLEALLGFARASSEADQLEAAIETLEDGRQSFPASHDLLYTLSRAYLSASRPEEALQSAKQAVELAPNSISALEVLREAAIENGEPEEALASQQAILKVRPHDSHAHLKMAQLYADQSDPMLARSHLARAIWHSRSQGGELASLAPAAELISGSKLAQKLLIRAAALNPGNPEIMEALARHSEAALDFETAQASWLEISKHARHDPNPLQRAAHALTKLGRRTAALGLQQRALEIAPDAPQHLALAHTLAAAGDSTASLDHYLEAARLAPDDMEIIIPAAKGIGELGTIVQAQAVLQAAAGHAMGAEHAALIQAEFALATGDASAAAKLLGEVPGQSCKSPSLTSLKIRADRSLGRIGEAQAAFSELVAAPVASSADLGAVIKAALSIHAWDEAIACLEQGFEAFEFDGQLVYLAESLAHRFRDLEWLFRITGNAEGHSPNADEARLLNLLDRCREFKDDLEPVRASMLDLWGALQSGSIGTDEYHRIHALPRSVRSDLTEAGIIGLLKANRPARAVELMNSLEDDISESQVIIILRAIGETMLGHFHTAVDILEGVTQDALLQPLALYLQAEALRKAGEDQAYMTKLNAALAVWPEEHRWHFELAESYLANDHFDAAIPHLQQAVEQSPHDAQYLVELARAFRSVGQLDDAQAMYAASLQLSPKTAQIWKEAGDVALAVGNIEGAEKWLERACTLAPSDACCLIQSARAALARGDHKTAMKRAQAAYRLQPEEPSVLAGLAEILAKDGKLEKAIQMYDNALKTADDDLKIKLARAMLLAKSGRAREAVQEMKTIVAQTPEDDSAWSALAQAERDAGDLEPALEAASQALKLSPRNVGHMYLVGVICRESGQLDRALSTLSEAAKFAHKDAKLARELGKVYEARREAHLALESYKQAIELDPQDFDSLMHAGLILKNIKLYDQAGALFERGVQINPLDPQALQQLATIRALQLIHGNNAEAEAVPTS